MTIIILSDEKLREMFDVADEWNGKNGTSEMLDLYEAMRDDIRNDVVSQQMRAEKIAPNRDDSFDGEQIKAVGNALEAYIIGESNGNRLKRKQIRAELKKYGVRIARTE